MKILYRFIILIFCILLNGCERPVDVNLQDDGIPPAVPAGLKIYYAADGEVGIEWLDNIEPDVTGYNIYRRTESAVPGLLAYTGRNFYFDDSLSYDSVYYYCISAVDKSGLESAYTAEVTARPVNKFAPDTPDGVTINARNWLGLTSVYLRWSASEESDISGYKIYRSLSAGFSVDTISYLGYTPAAEFDDTTADEFYKSYYYRIAAVDKGGLESDPTQEYSDMILEAPVLLYPPDNSTVAGLREFLIYTTGAPASYKLVVQTGLFFGEIWQSDFTTESIHDTLGVDIPSGVFYYNTPYYWRAAVYTKSTQPNSITPLNKFIIKQ